MRELRLMSHQHIGRTENWPQIKAGEIGVEPETPNLIVQHVINNATPASFMVKSDTLSLYKMT